MKDFDNLSDEVAHVIRLHDRGIICPTEMWASIARRLTRENAIEALDALPEDSKESLRSVYVGRPPIVYAREYDDDGPDHRAVCTRIVRWCEEGTTPTPPQPEIDGMRRVRVEEGRVVEWLPEAEA